MKGDAESEEWSINSVFILFAHFFKLCDLNPSGREIKSFTKKMKKLIKGNGIVECNYPERLMAIIQ